MSTRQEPLFYIIGTDRATDQSTSTATKLAEMLQVELLTIRKHMKRRHAAYAIRYGYSKRSVADRNFSRVYNTAQAIKTNADKLRAFGEMQKHNIPIPILYKGQRTIEDIQMQPITADALPVMRRMTHHKQGRDIIIVGSMDDIPSGDFYTKVVPSTTEYRVHMMLGQCIRLQRKINTDDEEEDSIPIRSRHNGYKFRDVTKTKDTTKEKLVKVSYRAIRALKLDFGAVDVLYNADTDEVTVLEVNTSPRLDLYGRQLYCYHFRDILGLDQIQEQMTKLRFHDDGSISKKNVSEV